MPPALQVILLSPSRDFGEEKHLLPLFPSLMNTALPQKLLNPHILLPIMFLQSQGQEQEEVALGGGWW